MTPIHPCWFTVQHKDLFFSVPIALAVVATQVLILSNTGIGTAHSAPRPILKYTSGCETINGSYRSIQLSAIKGDF